MSQALHLLIAEDNPADADLVLRELRRAGFDPIWQRVETEEEYLLKLDSSIEIVLSDYSMPQFSGSRALELLKERKLDIPFIIISGTIGEDVAVEMMKMGASDYLIKDRLARLGQAVRQELEECKARAERNAQLLLQSTALETTANGVMITDTGGLIQWVNPAFTSLTGYSAEEALGQHTRILKSGRQSQEFYKELWDTILAGRTWHGCFVNRRKDGTLYYDEHTITPVRSRAGAIEHFVTIMHDMTERRRAEEAVREAEKKYRDIFDNCIEGIFQTTPDGRYINANPALARIYGYESPAQLMADLDDISGKLYMDFQRREEFMRLVQERGSVSDFESQVRRKDGKIVWISEKARVVRDGRHAVLYYEGTVEDVTERKRAEEKLNFQKSLLEAQSEASIDGILTVDADAKIISFNRRFVEMWAIPEELVTAHLDEPLLKKVVDDIVEPQQFLDRVRYLYEHPDLVSQEEIVLKDGRVFDRHTSPVKGSDGIYFGRIWTFRDITERKRSEEELRESEHRFREMMENLELVAVMLDTRGRLVFCNDYLLRLTGWKREEVIGSDYIEKFLLENDSATRTAYWDHIDAGTVPAHHENPIKTRSGDLRQIVWNNTILRDSDGKVTGVASVGQDVTDSRRATERIAEQAALIDQTHDAIIVRDLVEGIKFWSRGAERLYGYACGEVMGRKSGDFLYDAAGIAKLHEAQAATIAADEWSGELQQIVKDGRKVTVEGRWTLMRDEQGNPKSILAINTDVTEKKKIEAQFLRAQRMESIGTLASGVAHDLNNILAPIMMSIEVLKEIPEGEQKRRILETIEASAQRGAEIVQQVLSFGRGMEGKRVEVQAKHLLKDVERIMRDTFPKDIRLRVSAASDARTVLGDPTQLYQVLLNLCVNSRDAMPNGGDILVEIKNFTVDENFAVVNLHARPGPHVLIEVTDTGTGIPKDVIEKIFDPFFTTKELGKGTGLGLSTVMAIVKSHGGFVNVYSEPGKGTTFRVYLPALTAQRAEEAEAESASLPRGDGETVLLIDDEASILTIARQTLEAFGYNVLTADNGAAAIALYAQHMKEISVVLTDMMMPVMDGKATIIALKTINPEIKIIAASGLNANGVIASAADSGVKHFLTKPYTAATLLKMFRMVLDEDSQVSL